MLKLIRWLRKIILKYTMAGYEDIMQRAADYQSVYAGNKFQCMRTKTLNDPRLGEVFTVKKIEPQRNGQIFATLSDNSQITVETLNASFQMISDPGQIIPKAEVIHMHNRLKKASDLTEVKSTAKDILGDIYDSIVPDVAPAPAQQPINILAGIEPLQSQQQPPQQQQIVVSNVDLSKQLFGMFTVAPTDLEFSVPVKLPDLSLIQMMYAQASDKDEFITNFSQYVMQSIDLDSVKKAMSTLMEPKAKKIRAPKAWNIKSV